MSGVSITGLNPASTLTGAELVPVVQSGTTAKTTVAALGAAVAYTPAGTGAVTTTVQTKLRETVSVKDFGAVGNGIADDTAAIQAAIDAVKAAGGGIINIPTGTYKISTTLNLTNLGNIPITLKGSGKTDGFPSSTSVATNLLGSTGAYAVIETQGSNGVCLEDFNIYTQTSDANKSLVGIFIGRTATNTAAEFHNYERIGIYLRTSPTANSNNGTVGLWNIAGEHGFYKHIEIIADTAMFMFETDTTLGQAVYTPKYAAIYNVASCTLITFIECAFISLSKAAIQLRGVVTVSFIDCYYGNSSGTGNLPCAVAIKPSSSNTVQNVLFSGQMENWDSFISIDTVNGCKKIDIKITVAGTQPANPLVYTTITSTNIYGLYAFFVNPGGYALSLVGTAGTTECTYTGGVFNIPDNTSINSTHVYFRGVQVQDYIYTGASITLGAGSSYVVFKRDTTWQSTTIGIPLMNSGIAVTTPDGTKKYIIAVNNSGTVTSTLA